MAQVRIRKRMTAWLEKYHTGMRLGEILGLSWSDIDFEGKRINLRRQIVYLKRRGYFFTTSEIKNNLGTSTFISTCTTL